MADEYDDYLTAAQHGAKGSAGDEVSAEADAALEEALGGTPRASELYEMQLVLTKRRDQFVAELDRETDEAEREHIRQEIAQMERDIAVLAKEGQINQFVEDAIRVGSEMRKLH